jgi:hypothetical protein
MDAPYDGKPEEAAVFMSGVLLDWPLPRFAAQFRAVRSSLARSQ